MIMDLVFLKAKRSRMMFSATAWMYVTVTISIKAM
jgi:hypothetical protein